MATYTVTAAVKKKDVPAKEEGRQPMQVIGLLLTDGDGKAQEAEWFTRATTQVPAEGQQLEGTLEPGPYGLKFKKAPVATGFGGRARDPRETAAIQRQHSQEMALRALTVRVAQGEQFDRDSFWEALRAAIDWFEQDIQNHALNRAA